MKTLLNLSLLFFGVAIISGSNLYSHDIIWETKVEFANFNPSGNHKIFELKDSSIIWFLGFKQSFTPNNYANCIIKTDKDGNVTWLNKDTSIQKITPIDIFEVNDGDLLCYCIIAEFYYDSYRFKPIILRLDSEGQIIERKTDTVFALKTPYKVSEASIVDYDRNIYHFEVYKIGNNQNLLIADKWDSGANYINRIVIDTLSDTDSEISRVAIDNGFILSDSSFMLKIDKYVGRGNYSALIKLSKNLSIEKNFDIYRIGSYWYNLIRTIETKDRRGFLIFGLTNSRSGSDTSKYDYFIRNYDNNTGVNYELILYRKENFWYNNAFLLQDKSIILLCDTAVLDGKYNYLLKINVYTDSIWQKIWRSKNKEYLMNNGIESNDGGILLLCYATKSEEGDEDALYLVKLNNNPSSIEYSSKAESGAILYPNPAEGSVSFRLDGGLRSVSVFNLLGVELLTKEFAGGSGFASLDISGLPPGAYLIKFRYESGAVRAMKFSVER